VNEPAVPPHRTLLIDTPAGRLGGVLADAGGLVAGTGAPLLLLHSVNAAASVAEMRPLLERWAARRPVYAFDLPGFGTSERSDRAYTPRLMTDAVQAMADHVQALHGSAPLDALALSTGCEFLALVSPTGLMGTRPRRGAPGRTRAVPGLHRLLAQPLWGESLFRQLTRPGVVHYFLRRTWGGPGVDAQLWADAVAAARAPGAHHAPLHFLSGGLFSADILSVYEALPQPVWVSHGTRGDFTDYRGLVHLRGRPNWRVSVFEGGALPYFEHPEAFDAELRAHWA
jgi:pimeloyl-ACP methyl ester carboxylesterase